MNGEEKLKELYMKAKEFRKHIFSEEVKINLKNLENRLASNKGVYTVLISLGVYKLLNPNQDIRYHQTSLKNGFSGRSFDTKYITPTLKKLGLLSMAESGWLTRSLEHNSPYDFSYQGQITPLEIKNTFLFLINEIQFNDEARETILIRILELAIEYKVKNDVKIKPLANKDELTIEKIIAVLETHFFSKYYYAGASKLPVIAFYSIYQQLIPEMKRFNNCILEPLGSHTASDRTSNSSGDIEIKCNEEHFESVEIKHNRLIDSNVLRIAQEKIYIFNPKRYYILSNIGLKMEDRYEIEEIIYEVKKEHGCQIIVNGIIHTLKYYLRLVNNLEDFINIYISNIMCDRELKTEHKEKLIELINFYLK
ncbi:DNA methyltransferase [Aliarcobacter butzleri]